MKNRSGHTLDVQHSTNTIPTTAPQGALLVDFDSAGRLVAAVGAWASRVRKADASIEGYRLLNVLRIHARPIHGMRALDHEADRLRRLVNSGDAEGWKARYTAHQDAEKAADAAYAAAMQDVYTVFEILTGVSADTTRGLSLNIPVRDVAAAASVLTAVNV